MSSKKISIYVSENEEVLVLKKSTIRKLEKNGKMFSTYDDVVDELSSHCDTCERFWVDRV